MVNADPITAILLERLEHARVFAAIDAAKLDFLQEILTSQGLKFDPLYLDEIDAPSVASGPHLVDISGIGDLQKIQAIIGDSASCVWWIWPDEPDAYDAIYRHLRGLNMVEIPAGRFDGEQPGARTGYEAVLFRHADPEALNGVLEVLDTGQVARLFGPALALVARTPNANDPRLFEKPEDLPLPTRGMLRIASLEQYDAIAESRSTTLRARIAGALYDLEMDQHGLDADETFEDLAVIAESTGAQIGLESERAFILWAFCGAVAGTGALYSRDLLSFFTGHDETPDDVVEGIVAGFAQLDQSAFESIIAQEFD